MTTDVALASFPDGVPLSGWHYVCPCGWTTHSHLFPPHQEVQAHRGWHDMQIARLGRTDDGD